MIVADLTDPTLCAANTRALGRPSFFWVYGLPTPQIVTAEQRRAAKSKRKAERAARRRNRNP